MNLGTYGEPMSAKPGRPAIPVGRASAYQTESRTMKCATMRTSSATSTSIGDSHTPRRRQFARNAALVCLVATLSALLAFAPRKAEAEFFAISAAVLALGNALINLFDSRSDVTGVTVQQNRVLLLQNSRSLKAVHDRMDEYIHAMQGISDKIDNLPEIFRKDLKDAFERENMNKARAIYGLFSASLEKKRMVGASSDIKKIILEYQILCSGLIQSALQASTGMGSNGLSTDTAFAVLHCANGELLFMLPATLPQEFFDNNDVYAVKKHIRPHVKKYVNVFRHIENLAKSNLTEQHEWLDQNITALGSLVNKLKDYNNALAEALRSHRAGPSCPVDLSPCGDSLFEIFDVLTTLHSTNPRLIRDTSDLFWSKDQPGSTLYLLNHLNPTVEIRIALRDQWHTILRVVGTVKPVFEKDYHLIFRPFAGRGRSRGGPPDRLNFRDPYKRIHSIYDGEHERFWDLRGTRFVKRTCTLVSSEPLRIPGAELMMACP